MGKLFILTGPSGVGKNMVLDRAVRLGYRFARVVTTSTRKMRKGESEGHPYHFVDHQTFQAMIDSGEMLEWAKVHTDLYGTPKKAVGAVLKTKSPVILEIDPQGARTIRGKLPGTPVIFLAPPSLEILEKRLRARRSEDEASFQVRFETGKRLLEDISEWDFVVTNKEDQVDDCVRKLMAIIGSACG